VSLAVDSEYPDQDPRHWDHVDPMVPSSWGSRFEFILVAAKCTQVLIMPRRGTPMMVRRLEEWYLVGRYTKSPSCSVRQRHKHATSSSVMGSPGLEV
jgi:hypothetical protein